MSSTQEHLERMTQAYPDPPYNCGLVFAYAGEVGAVVTPFYIPNLVSMDGQDCRGDSWKSGLVALVIRIEGK